MNIKFFSIFFLLFTTLIATGCGGGSSDRPEFSTGNDSASGNDTDVGSSTDEDDDDGGVDPSTLTSNISYYPLAVYEAFKDYSGYELDGVFQGEVDTPFIKTNFINPILASDQTSTDTATAEDYVVTVNESEIDPSESFPLLQKVLGNHVFLRTALVFDLSSSNDSTDFSALVAEAKTYITTAQAHADPSIANQEFAVWVFGQNIDELTSGFTNNTSDINTALDAVITSADTNAVGTSSNLHRAMVEVTGRYAKDTYDFSADGDNDLVDRATSRGIFLSQMVLFSSGPDTVMEMDQTEMINAIQSQGLIKYDDEGKDSFIYKPVFYYVMGGSEQGDAYEELADESETVTYLTLSAGTYDFAGNLVQNQINAIDARIDLDSQYSFRWAFLPRVGDHTTVFRSNSNGYNYSLITTYKEMNSPLGTPEVELASLVEITGPNNEFLSLGIASLSEVSTFAPATRWVNDEYAAGDYSWVLAGGTGTLNGDGTYTVNSIAGTIATLTLTNDLRGENASITITN